ncbi:MAG: hypothetical protein ACK5QT_07655 [Oligoflexia bacterium]
MKRLSRKISGLATVSTLSLLTAAGLAGCGQQSFDTLSTVTQSKSPGFVQIAPKVDIVLAQDNTGSMFSIYDDIGAQMPGFLDQLSNSGWDYHFASIPLTAANMDQRQFTQVLASRQDRNWGSFDWLAPYPGALFGDTDSGQINATYFRRPSQYSDYRDNLFPTTSLSGLEPGLENIRRQLKNHMAESNFHRPDALLVVIVVGNGNDTSGIKICRREDGVEAPCETAGMGGAAYSHCGTPSADGSPVPENLCSPGSLSSNTGNLTPGTYNYAREFYRQQLQSLRPSPSQVKLYAAVSQQNGSANCYGESSRAGTQYSAVASATGGTSHNICTQGAATVLSSIQQQLTVTRMALRTVYLMLDSEPDPSSIRVIKYVGGDRNNSVEIPQSASNGWTYAGRIINQPRVVTSGPNPVTMNTATGFAVRLNGSAQLTGDDTAEVRFSPPASL